MSMENPSRFQIGLFVCVWGGGGGGEGGCWLMLPLPLAPTHISSIKTCHFEISAEYREASTDVKN